MSNILHSECQLHLQAIHVNVEFMETSFPELDAVVRERTEDLAG